jgi:hypothetical protein
MAERHGRARSKLVIRALALGILAALAAGAALAADRGDCRYIGYDGYAGISRCDKRPEPTLDLDEPTGRKGGSMKPSAARAGNAEDVVWDFDGDGFDDAPGEIEPVVPLPSTGQRTIALKVTDPHGREATAERTIEVHDGNVAPELLAYPDNRDVVPVGSKYTLGALVRDFDDRDVDVTVDFGDGASHDYDAVGGWYEGIEHAYTSGGVKTVTVTATDGELATILSFTIRIGGPAGTIDPKVNSFDADTHRAGRVTMLSQYAYDSDSPGAVLDYDWDLDGDGAYDDSTNEAVPHTFAAGAPATYGVRITDSNGGETTVRKTIVPTTINVGPRAGITVLPEEPRAGVPADIYGYGGDSDTFDDVTLSYDLDGDGVFEIADGSDMFEHTFATTGKHTVAIRVVDSEGATAIHRTDVMVASAAPTGSFTWSPSRPNPGDTITFSGTGTDPDGTEVELEWDLDADAQWDDADGNSATKSFPAEGWQPVSLRVTDENDDVKVITHYIPVGDVINHKPRASFTVSPAAPRAGQPVTFTSTTTDPDGDSLTDYYWEIDGADGSGATTTRTFASAGTYDVYLYVEDNRGGWDDVSGTVTVSAAQPSGGGGGGTTNPPADTTAPTLKLNAIAKKALKLGTVRSKGLKVPVGCSESCTATLELVADKATAKKLKLGKKAVVVGRATGQVAANGTLTVRLTTKAKKALKKAKKVKLKLGGTASDAAGNKSVLPAKTLTLKK